VNGVPELAPEMEAKKTRILEAVALGRPDRVPVVVEYAAFAARVTNTPLPEFYSSSAVAMQTMIKAYRLISEVAEPDAINYGANSAYGLAYLWLSKIRIPGVDLPDDVQHQVSETGLMTVEDYDRILDEGWPDFYQSFVMTKVLDDVPPELLPMNQPPLDIGPEWASKGIPVLSGGGLATPFEMLCGGRSLSQFIVDLATMPDKVEAVMDAILPNLAAPGCQAALAGNFPLCWVGGWRTASHMLSPKLWDRFAWPYMERLVNEVVDAGLIACLHLDGNWTRDLARFRELPKGRCVMALDGYTDIFEAKEILGDHMCLMGDVPATLLSLGTPDEVHEYSSRLIRELGPEGFILQSGCDIPIDAKLANVQAMVAAATGN
jgi:uroporphyrinogen-III decarboxylase